MFYWRRIRTYWYLVLLFFSSFLNSVSILGPGGIFVLERDEKTGKLNEILKSDYVDNLMDICWSESDPNVLSTGNPEVLR